MRRHFSKRPLWQRAIALTAAYAIALSSLIASVAAARAAAEAATAPNLVICHTIVAGDEAPSPASDQSNDRHCAANCCTGCLMLLAALPQPLNIAGVPLVASHRVVALQSAVAIDDLRDKSHQSRAPPLPA